jgi:ABC-type glucose/galactose transport system permease subunit
MNEALYSEVSEEATEAEGLTLPEETDINIGRRQTLVGTVSTCILLALINIQPVYEYMGNTIVMVFNGIIILALLGYTVEGFLDWHSPVKHSTEVEEGE